jgi:putative aminopeptidase FrvX
MEARTLELFRELTELPGAPGFEHAVRGFMRGRLEPYADEIITDRLGSLFGVIRGQADPSGGPRIMVAGHMDEVALMVTSITDHGMLKFQPLGGWSPEVLPAQRMQVITDNGPVDGVIASVPPHLQKDGKSAPLGIDQMILDVGADSAEDAMRMGIRPGLPIVPVCPFTPLANPEKIMAKAWDNRYGVGLAIELVQQMSGEKDRLPNTLFAGATVQEELGLRGAETAARLIDPDLFIALDASPAGDAFGDRKAFGQLGKGTLIRVMDRTMVTHKGLVEFMLDLASTHRIPHQFFVSPGGTDAGKVHLHGIGVPSAVIGICARYIHTSASIIHIGDYAAAREMLFQFVRAMDRSAFETLIAY